MSPRTRKRGAAAPSGPVVRFVELEHAGMIVLRDTTVDPAKVHGSYVKVAPTVRSSERSTVDARALREQLTEAGACAVVVAPVVVPDAVASRKEKPAVRSAEEHLREWFAGAKGMDPDVLKEALDAALSAAEASGL